MNAQSAHSFLIVPVFIYSAADQPRSTLFSSAKNAF